MRTDFAAQLRRHRSERGVTQQTAARGMGVERATLTQWESGRHLPSPEKVRVIDDYYGAGGVLTALAEAARTGTAAQPLPRLLLLTNVFAAVGRGLVRHLIADAAGRPLGWCHNLGTGTTPTPLSTSYVIRTLLLLDEAAVDLGPVISRVKERQVGGGWSNRIDGPPRPEVTAVVVDALSRLGADADLAAAWHSLESSIDTVARERPYVLTTVLETAVRIRPDSPFVTRLIDDLLVARKDCGHVLLWPATAAPGIARVEASLVHTARAVTVLKAAQAAVDRPDVDEAVGQAVEWIVARDRADDGVTEILRDPDSRRLDVPINHFTSPWVLRALAGSEGVPGPRVQAALTMLWDSYSPIDGLWAWTHDGTLPTWMTYDAIAALRVAALASFRTPITATPGE
ncbi:MAG: helix-turn-helix domain-containing protein [Actinobacteria bacterium]|nr:helix-turn-helix domain-containing protein [Actinomycetota bacterium]